LIAEERSGRLANMFLKDKEGRRPVYGGTQKFQEDPHWRDLVLFYEYFHGGNGAGGIKVQACGDCHLLNFGFCATPERNLVFDVNDFDETLPAPWEWDVKRLAASFVVAGRDQHLTNDDCRTAAVECGPVRAHRRLVRGAILNESNRISAVHHVENSNRSPVPVTVSDQHARLAHGALAWTRSKSDIGRHS
jgi:hypothetical protein